MNIQICSACGQSIKQPDFTGTGWDYLKNAPYEYDKTDKKVEDCRCVVGNSGKCIKCGK